MVTFLQSSFTGGELSPSVYGQVNLSKYAVGAKTMRNMFVLAWGGCSNRAGFKFVGEVADSTVRHRNIEFQFNTEQTYTLEFGNQTMRVVQDGAYVTETAKTITGITKANPGVVTSNTHGFNDGDHVYLSGIGGMTELNGRTVKVANKTTNTFELQDLGGSNIDTSGYTTFTSGGNAARIYQISTPYLAADLFEIEYVQPNDTMTLTHPSYAARDLTRTGHAAWTLTTTTFAAAIAAPGGVSATATTGSGSQTFAYVVTAIDSATGEESVASSSSSCTNDLSTAGNFNTVTWTAVSGASNYYVYKDDNGSGVFGYIGTASGTSFQDRNIEPDKTDAPQTAYNPFGSSNNYPSTATYFQERRFYANTNNKPQTFNGSQAGSYRNFNKSFPIKGDDAVEFTIASRQANEIRHMVPLLDLLLLTSGGEFAARGDGQGNPITAEQINILPQSYYGSSTVRPLVIGNVAMFIQEQGQIVRDMAFEFSADGYVGTDLTVLSRHLFEGHTIVDWCYAQTPYSIVWAVRSDGVLLSLTYLREHQVWGWARHDTDGFVESVCAKNEGDETAVYAIIRRMVNGRTVRYQERAQSRVVDDVRDSFFVDSGLSYDTPIAVSAISKADPVVVTTSTNHGLTTGDLVDFGRLDTTDYDANSGRYTEHPASNKRYAVTVTSGTTFSIQDFEFGDDIDGTAWATYDGNGVVRAAVTSVGGLWHLEGKTVSILADGNVHPQKVVSGGRVTLDYAASRVHVGLPYVSDLETLPIELVTQSGSIQGRRKNIPYLTIRFEKSRGGYAGLSQDNLFEMKQAIDTEFHEPIALITGDFQQRLGGDWTNSGQVFIRQSDPLPMTILSVMPELEVGGH